MERGVGIKAGLEYVSVPDDEGFNEKMLLLLCAGKSTSHWL